MNEKEHQLLYQWTFWVDDLGEKNAKFEDYVKNLKQLDSCTSIESFWKAYSHLPSIELLQNQKVTVSFMKNDIQPLWEDKRNQNGSILTLRCLKKTTAHFWKSLLIEMISQNHSLLNGISLSIKKEYNIISLWITTTKRNDQEEILQFLFSCFPQISMDEICLKANKQHQAYSQ